MKRPSLLAALAAAALALALQLSSGMYEVRSVVILGLAAALAVAAALWNRSGAPGDTARAAGILLGGGCAWGLSCHFQGNPTFYADQRNLDGFRWLEMGALALLSAYLFPLRGWLARARFLALLICFAAMGVAVLRASPKPWIDVWVVQQGAAEGLLHGKNPYSITYQNIYGAQSGMIIKDLVVNGRFTGFSYPPLTPLTDLAGYMLFGDVRYTLLALMLAAAWLLSRIGEGPEAELAALFLLFQPRTFFVLEQSWTEPLLAATLALALWACARWREGRLKPVTAGIALGLLAASKQYSFYAALPIAFALPAQGRWKALATGAGTLAVLMLPFAIWDLDGFWFSMVRLQALAPFRPDSLSLSAAIAHATPGQFQWLTLVGLGLAAALFGWLLRPGLSLSRATSAAAAAWFVVLLFAKQAFCNYYWFCVALLCAAVCAQTRPAEVSTVRS